MGGQPDRGKCPQFEGWTASPDPVAERCVSRDGYAGCGTGSDLPGGDVALGNYVITWLEEAALFVVMAANDHAVSTSQDFVSFERLPSPVPITSAVAALPDRPGMLLVGTDGLYTLEAECPTGG